MRDEPGRQNGVDYPDGGETVPDQQRIAYPDLAPIELDLSPSQALERAQRVAEGLGWTVTAVDRERGIVEAFDVTRFFRFVDDVVNPRTAAGCGLRRRPALPTRAWAGEIWGRMPGASAPSAIGCWNRAERLSSMAHMAHHFEPIRRTAAAPSWVLLPEDAILTGDPER